MFSPFTFTNNGHRGRLTRVLYAPALFVLLSASVLAQELPKTIRGYKVHRESITVSAVTGENSADASVKVGDPDIAEATLTGIVFELPAEVLSTKQSGKIDLLTFRDVKVNGIGVEVEEYAHRFELQKGKKVSLPAPARIFFPLTGILRTSWSEMRDSRDEWIVSGRVFVFGRFRRLGMYHQRVVPVDFEIKIKNPLIRK